MRIGFWRRNVTDFRAFACVTLLGAMLAGPARAQEAGGVVIFVTPTDDRACSLFDVSEIGASVVCPGPDGHSLIIFDNDLRVDLGFIAPGWTRRAEIRLTPHFGGAFRNLSGDTVQWISPDGAETARAQAVIAPFVISTSEGDNHEMITTFALDRPVEGEVCLIYFADSTAETREAALTAADEAAETPCLKPEH